MKKIFNLILLAVTIIIIGCSEKYTLHIKIEPDSSVGQIILSPDLSEYKEGTVVKLNPEANTSIYNFSEWGGLDGDKVNNSKITMTEDMFITAIYEYIPSGSSGLEIINNTEYDARIYFDEDYIGKVEALEDRIWSVPIGDHTVISKIEGFNDVISQSTFTSNTYFSVTLFIEYTKKSINVNENENKIKN